MINIIRPLDVKLGYQKNTIRYENDTILDGDCKVVRTGILRNVVACNHGGMIKVYNPRRWY